jgi:hypothetical protein
MRLLLLLLLLLRRLSRSTHRTSSSGRRRRSGGRGAALHLACRVVIVAAVHLADVHRSVGVLLVLLLWQ